jgi:hypothetical protein
MNKYIYIIFAIFLSIGTVAEINAGNPDRQGEAGAAQLLLNPWARSAGLHTMTTAFVSGVEATILNPAGLVRINKSEFVVAHTRYLEGTDIGINTFGLAQKTGKNGAFGLSIMVIDMGDIPVTTENQPEGTGATFSPSLFNMGITYAHNFDNKISVGLTFRIISETTADISAFGMSVDAGVQYVTGPQDNFKFGVSLRNIGTPMTFSGQGLDVAAPNPNSTEIPYALTFSQRAQKYELPSVLNIGLSYDFIINPKNRLTLVGNFTSNSFSQDQLGGGIEYSFNNIFMLRGGYKYEVGSLENDSVGAPVYSGISGGFSIEVPLKKETNSTFGIDYAYRTTRVWNGTHNIAIRFAF